MSAYHSGLLLYNKPIGLTSFDSLKVIKKAFNTRKAGHTGTLDKFANGLLLVLLEKGLKLAPLFQYSTKRYTAKLFLGSETDTLCPEGKVIARGEVPSREDFEAVFDSFRGEIMQSPPAYSAVHISGKRAYELAREGKEPEMKKRPVKIYNLELLSFEPPYAEINVLVSSGTYIRSLARDMAHSANSFAHLVSLSRTSIANFSLKDAVSADDGDLVKRLLPMDKLLFQKLSLPVFYINDSKSFFQGKALSKILSEEDLHSSWDMETPSFAGVFNTEEEDKCLGYLIKDKNKWKYGHVYANN